MRRPSPQRKVGAWDSSAKPVQLPPAVPPAAAVVRRITIENAIKIFIDNREGAKLAQPTLSKYRTVTRRLGTVADTRGYVMLSQFTQADMDVFYARLERQRAHQSKTSGHVTSVFPLLSQ